MSTPRLYGLVLAGGKSTRMGQDKGLIEWHGKPQRYLMADMLAEMCDEVYISCRADQAEGIVADGYQALADASEADEQYGALLTAMEHEPSAAWLVVACDVPLIDTSMLDDLIAGRNTSSIATAYRSPEDGLPEPLIAIWEPKAQAMLRQKLAEGVRCPRKALIQSGSAVALLDPASPERTMNVNTPEAAQLASEYIARGGNG